MKKILLLMLIVLFNISIVEGYDNHFVHQTINENAAIKSTNLLNVLENLGFPHRIENVVYGIKIYRWFLEGARLEDETHCRSKFHFHDPIKSWNEAGLSNAFVDTLCADYRHKSSLVWAQGQDNDWSWQKGRQFYFEALTSSNAQVREQELAYTFRSLGQIMHLISDSSVPAHTRNDIHVFPYTVPYIGITFGSPTFESWAKEHHKQLSYKGIFIDRSVFNNSVDDITSPIAISALWDQNLYLMMNPSITVNAVTGLAEYSNANFFSKNTIFTDYDYPAWSSVVESTEAIDGKDRIYLKKVADGAVLAHLARAGRFYKYLPADLKHMALKLDEKCHADYAEKLIPRAVGYSSALLDYFFRGTLEITAPDSYVYSITDGSAVPYLYEYEEDDITHQIPQQQFTHIKAKVRNTTSNEDIQDGIIQAVARYKMRRDYLPDLSKEPPSSASRENAYSYSVSETILLTLDGIDTINSTEPQEFTFDFVNDPIPAGITDLFLHVIFKGTLGHETDTSIAIGTKDIFEPTHHVFWNLTDMFSLDGHLYSEEEIRNKPPLAHKVDYDRDNIFNETDIGEPYIDPLMTTFVISYSDVFNPEYPVEPIAQVHLPEGRHIRLIMLLGKKDGNSLRLAWTDSVYPEAYHDFIFSAVVNQEEIDEEGNSVFRFTPSVNFRGIHQNFSQGVLHCEPPAASNECAYPEEETIIPIDSTPYPLDNIFFP